ncbi:hypothetical protein H5410_038912 [Solanum commersonii]|uniref:SLC26A/SulP transporter domain-containing protein n=1 Tax=Solanum commersonii TaxID=4109 RepID=A0A9J5YDL1_SOLCO|nr:hypothetical protein H5410_038912 [Solanum commersonii]
MLIPRCRFEVNLEDNSGSTTGMIMDKEGEKLLSLTAEQIYERASTKINCPPIKDIDTSFVNKIFSIRAKKAFARTSNATAAKLYIQSCRLLEKKQWRRCQLESPAWSPIHRQLHRRWHQYVLSVLDNNFVTEESKYTYFKDLFSRNQLSSQTSLVKTKACASEVVIKKARRNSFVLVPDEPAALRQLWDTDSLIEIYPEGGEEKALWFLILRYIGFPHLNLHRLNLGSESFVFIRCINKFGFVLFVDEDSKLLNSNCGLATYAIDSEQQFSPMGISRDLAVGTVAIGSLLMASMLGAEVNPAENPTLYLHLAFTATFFTDWDFLSHATIVGFMGGAATVVILQQLKRILGLEHFTHATDVVSVFAQTHAVPLFSHVFKHDE